VSGNTKEDPASASAVIAAGPAVYYRSGIWHSFPLAWTLFFGSGVDFSGALFFPLEPRLGDHHWPAIRFHVALSRNERQ